MATPKKTKAQLRQEIKDLKNILAYVRREHGEIMQLALPKARETTMIEEAFKNETKRTGHTLDRLSRNGFMHQGVTVTQARMVNEQMKLFTELLRQTEKRIAYLDRQIGKRQEALKK